jgi:hypothetical protein
MFPFSVSKKGRVIVGDLHVKEILKSSSFKGTSEKDMVALERFIK